MLVVVSITAVGKLCMICIMADSRLKYGRKVCDCLREGGLLLGLV